MIWGMDYGKLSKEDRAAYDNAVRVKRRRELFAAAFTPDVLDELEEFLGVKDVVFAFQASAGEGYDACRAAQRDALLGVVRALRFEVARVDEARDLVSKLDAMINNA